MEKSKANQCHTQKLCSRRRQTWPKGPRMCTAFKMGEEVLEADPESLGMSPALRGPSGPNPTDLSYPTSECWGSMGFDAKAPAGEPRTSRILESWRRRQEAEEYLAVSCSP